MSAPVNWRLLPAVKFIFTLAVTVIITNVINVVSDDIHDFFLCRKCGKEIVQLNSLVNIPASKAMRQRNDTFGPKSEVLIQLLKNPHGNLFEVITALDANIYRTSEAFNSDTWFSGFSWRILACPRCKMHIGWEYIPNDESDKSQKSFFGLVLSSLLYENDADNLLVIPKSYRS